MAKYMLIMRNNGSAQDLKDLDFETVINMMGAYNESMMKTGILLGGDGLSDAGQGAVVEFTTAGPIVSDGPYGETHELFNGFWTVQVSTREEAIEWASRAPLGPGNKIEIRRITDESDFVDYSDNAYIKKEKGWREQQATMDS